jgi:hypothetical protein
MSSWKRNHLVVLALGYLCLTTSPAHAYVDPGSASIVITAVLGMIATAGYMLRSFWQKILEVFGLAAKTKKEDENWKSPRQDN